jgi:hypothetical protein
MTVTLFAFISDFFYFSPNLDFQTLFFLTGDSLLFFSLCLVHITAWTQVRLREFSSINLRKELYALRMRTVPVEAHRRDEKETRESL